MHSKEKSRYHAPGNRRRRKRRQRRICLVIWVFFITALLLVLRQAGILGNGNQKMVMAASVHWNMADLPTFHAQYRNVSDEEVHNAYQDASDQIFEESFDAESAVVLRNDDVLYEYNETEKLYPASMTKLLTALVAVEHGDLDEIVEIQDMSSMTCYSEGSKLAYLQAGDRISLRDLLGIMLVYSANDAATAIAVHIAGSEEAFADMANAYAEQLGAMNTHYTNPHGLQDENHYTCASDMVLFLKEAVANDTLLSMMQTENYQGSYERGGTSYTIVYPTTSLYLTGESSIEGFQYVAGKTGYTGEAGRCLAACFERDGNYYYSVVMKSEDYVEATTLLYYYVECPEQMQQVLVS